MKINIFLSCLLFAFAIGLSQKSKTLLFVGTYTDATPSKGIYIYEFNPKNGSLKLVNEKDNVINPSFLTISQNGKFLYACNETNGENATVSAFKIDAENNKLDFINKQKSGGNDPCFVNLYEDKFLLNGNYSGGNVSVFPLNKDGSLQEYSQKIDFFGSGLLKNRQEKAHIHQVVFSPKKDFVFLPDLGSDKIRVFPFDKNNLKPLIEKDSFSIQTIAGSGPRHLTFHPNKKIVYSIEELSGTVSVYRYNKGSLKSIQRVFTYSKKQDSYKSAEILASKDGKFLYVSNREEKENSIAIFSIDPKNSKLKLIKHQSTFGDHPRHFIIDESGAFLMVANQNTNNLIVFKRNRKTGLLTKLKDEIKISKPVCMVLKTY